MNAASTNHPACAHSIAARTLELFKEQHQNIIRHTDELFAWLMVCQWAASIGIAFWLSPLTWTGNVSRINPHVWLAVFLGGIITGVPVFFARMQPGETLTRHVIAVGQMLMSSLLIHLTGGRIETHFHVFGSLAILAFYRDWRVLVSATVVVVADHLLRGIFWPESVYGVLYAPVWRSFEHGGWVIFEDTFLIISIRKSLHEMFLVAERQAELEDVNETIERTVAERTAELTKEIAGRQKVEEALLESQALYLSLVDQLPAGVFRKDAAGCYVLVNSWFCELRGKKPEDFLKKFPAELVLSGQVTAEDIRLLNEGATHHEQIMKTGRPIEVDEQHVAADGTVRHVHVIKSPVFGPDRNVIGSQGILMDITDEKRAQEDLQRSEVQLRQAQKMEAVGRLAGGVAHDFNNLLTVISGYCAMSLLSMKEEDPLQTSIVEIQKASDRAASLTGQLLAFSRKQVLQPRVLQLAETLHSMEKMLHRLIGEDVELCTHYDPALGHVKADQGQIEQVIMNLAVNARDAMPRGGKLTIGVSNMVIDQKSDYRNRTLEPGRYILLAISDNGSGMTEEIRNHLFEPFFTTKGLGRGTGLGLATCYGIVTQSGGDIRVYSEPNAGTTFKIYLPRVDAPLEPVMAADSTRLPAGTESILIVEDESAVRTLASLILRNRGYKVYECGNAFDALAMMKKTPFDLVITDVIMPQMSGKQLCDEIKAQLPKTEVLLMSGYTDDALAHHGVLDEGLFFLEKPFSPAKLSQKVREVLDASKTTRLKRASVRTTEPPKPV